MGLQRSSVGDVVLGIVLGMCMALDPLGLVISTYQDRRGRFFRTLGGMAVFNPVVGSKFVYPSPSQDVGRVLGSMVGILLWVWYPIFGMLAQGAALICAMMSHFRVSRERYLGPAGNGHKERRCAGDTDSVE